MVYSNLTATNTNNYDKSISDQESKNSFLSLNTNSINNFSVHPNSSVQSNPYF
jgi:hypothetical protein